MDSIFQVSYHRLMRCRYYHTGHIWDKGKDRFAARGKTIKFNYIICCFILRTWVPSSLNCVKQTEAQRGLSTCSWFGETPKPVLFHWWRYLPSYKETLTLDTPSFHSGQFISPLYLFIFVNIKVMLTLGFWILLFC